MTQAELAAAAAVSRPIVSLIERGGAEETTIRTLRRVASALGISVAVIARWRGAEMARLLDESHARLVRAVVARLIVAGWTARPEHTFSVWGERGSVDVLAWQPAEQAIICVECKARLPDMQDLLATMDRKRRLARDIARLEGWRPAVVGSVLVLPERTWARNAVHKSSSLFDAALPARTTEIRHWLANPRSDVRGIWFLLDDSRANTTRRSGGEMRASGRRQDRSGHSAPSVSAQ
jgi:transcriptional regulator with XRE-family HTH domain